MRCSCNSTDNERTHDFRSAVCPVTVCHATLVLRLPRTFSSRASHCLSSPPALPGAASTSPRVCAALSRLPRRRQGALKDGAHPLPHPGALAAAAGPLGPPSRTSPPPSAGRALCSPSSAAVRAPPPGACPQEAPARAQLQRRARAAAARSPVQAPPLSAPRLRTGQAGTAAHGAEHLDVPEGSIPYT